MENGAENGTPVVVVAEPIHPWRWRLLTIWVVGFTLIVAYGLHVLTDEVNANKQAKTALCAYRQNLQDQIDDTRQFLQDIDSGKRQAIPGITRSDLTQTIRRQQGVVDALKNLDCPLVDRSS